MHYRSAMSSASLIALALAAPAFAQATDQAPARSQQSLPEAQAKADATAPVTTEPQNAAGIADIVVTATRQATNLQSTPIAITAVTSETLQTRAINGTADLSAVVPNATFRRVQGAYGPGVSAFIRGIGQGDTSLGSEPAVAYYIDDVYYPLLLGSNFDLLDVDHIEVLRGPQGTLFGRNALAGAINIVSKQPSMTDTSGYVQVTTGAYSRIDIRAGFSLPLADNLAMSVSGLSEKRDGYQRLVDFRCQMTKNGTPALAGTLPSVSNVSSDCTIGRLGGQDVRAGRATIRWEPTSRIKLTINGDYTNDKSANPADSLIAVVGPGAANVQSEAAHFGITLDSRFLTGNPYVAYATYRDPVGSGTVIPGNTFYNGFGPQRGGAQFPFRPDVVNWGVSAKLVVGLTDHIDATGIFGHRKLLDTHGYDVDDTPLTVEQTFLHIGETYNNAELRLSGKSKLLDWVAGGFYFDGDGFTHAIIYSPQAAFYRNQTISYSPNSKALYTNLTLKPFARLDITAGARWSDDSKYVNFANVNDTNIGNTIFQVDPKDKRFDWKFGADYRLTNSTMVYASASTGARLPGYNSRPFQPDQVGSFPGDETLAYEAGFKTDLFDHRLRLNAAGFYTDYKTRITTVTGAEINLVSGAPQAGVQTVVPLPGGPAGSTTCRTYNAATDGAANPAGGVAVLCVPRTYYQNTPGKVTGFELEAEARPIQNLLINAAVGYSHFKSADLEVATRANDRLAGLPEWNGTVGIQYTVNVPGLSGSITPRLDWVYTGSIDESAIENTYNQPAYSVFNLRVTYASEKSGFTVSAGATNLFAKLYYRNFFVYQDIGYPTVNAQPGPPREWYLQIGKKF